MFVGFAFLFAAIGLYATEKSRGSEITKFWGEQEYTLSVLLKSPDGRCCKIEGRQLFDAAQVNSDYLVFPILKVECKRPTESKPIRFEIRSGRVLLDGGQRQLERSKLNDFLWRETGPKDPFPAEVDCTIESIVAGRMDKVIRTVLEDDFYMNGKLTRVAGVRFRLSHFLLICALPILLVGGAGYCLFGQPHRQNTSS